jgi:hypothetical protein
LQLLARLTKRREQAADRSSMALDHEGGEAAGTLSGWVGDAEDTE